MATLHEVSSEVRPRLVRRDVVLLHIALCLPAVDPRKVFPRAWGQLGPFLRMWRSDSFDLRAMLRTLTSEQRNVAVALGRAVHGVASHSTAYAHTPSTHRPRDCRSVSCASATSLRNVSTAATQQGEADEADRTHDALTTELIPFMKKYPLPRENAKEMARLIASANANMATLQSLPEMEANVRDCEAQVLEGAPPFSTNAQWSRNRKRQLAHCVPWPPPSCK